MKKLVKDLQVGDQFSFERDEENNKYIVVSYKHAVDKYGNVFNLPYDMDVNVDEFEFGGSDSEARVKFQAIVNTIQRVKNSIEAGKRIRNKQWDDLRIDVSEKRPEDTLQKIAYERVLELINYAEQLKS